MDVQVGWVDDQVPASLMDEGDSHCTQQCFQFLHFCMALGFVAFSRDPTGESLLLSTDSNERAIWIALRC
jgi:hypothetical protein